jgi:adenylyltransferase/sulfurtransferase
MMNSEAQLFKSIATGSSVSKISELPVVGNRLLQSQVPQMSVLELKQLLDTQPSNLLLIDVRYKSEYELARLPGWVLVPYPEIQSGEGIAKIKKLLDDKRQRYPDRELHLVVMCKAGVRSAKALALLKEAEIIGINVQGGIDAWSKQIDSSIPQYSMKSISEDKPRQVKQRSISQRWLFGGGIAVALGTVAAVATVRHNPDLLRPAIQAGMPLEAGSQLPIVGYAIRQAQLPQIEVKQLKQLIDRKDSNFVLLDVRDPDEYQVSHIPGATLVPLPEIEKGAGIDKVESLLQGRRLIIYCTSGQRSARALMLLQDAGVKGTQVKGGIKAWNEQIDPSMPRKNW